jgi:hypothetical protein
MNKIKSLKFEQYDNMIIGNGYKFKCCIKLDNNKNIMYAYYYPFGVSHTLVSNYIYHYLDYPKEINIEQIKNVCNIKYEDMIIEHLNNWFYKED